MPQTNSAKKALRVNQHQRVANDRWRRKIREATRSIRKFIEAGEKQSAEEALKKASSVFDRAARRNIIHPNKAARKKSRLHKAISKLGK